MAQTISTSGNPFLRAADQLRTTGKLDRKDIIVDVAPSRSPRARLNFIPDDSMLGDMISRALAALSQGRIFDRGAILNLLV